jgi:hypothetical protein
MFSDPVVTTVAAVTVYAVQHNCSLADAVEHLSYLSTMALQGFAFDYAVAPVAPVTDAKPSSFVSNFAELRKARLASKMASPVAAVVTESGFTNADFNHVAPESKTASRKRLALSGDITPPVFTDHLLKAFIAPRDLSIIALRLSTLVKNVINSNTRWVKDAMKGKDERSLVVFSPDLFKAFASEIFSDARLSHIQDLTIDGVLGDISAQQRILVWLFFGSDLLAPPTYDSIPDLDIYVASLKDAITPEQRKALLEPDYTTLVSKVCTNEFLEHKFRKGHKATLEFAKCPKTLTAAFMPVPKHVACPLMVASH